MLRNEDRRHPVGEAGRRRVETVFTVDGMARAAAELYALTIERRSRAKRHADSGPCGQARQGPGPGAIEDSDDNGLDRAAGRLRRRDRRAFPRSESMTKLQEIAACPACGGSGSLVHWRPRSCLPGRRQLEHIPVRKVRNRLVESKAGWIGSRGAYVSAYYTHNARGSPDARLRRSGASARSALSGRLSYKHLAPSFLLSDWIGSVLGRLPPRVRPPTARANCSCRIVPTAAARYRVWKRRLPRLDEVAWVGRPWA